MKFRRATNSETYDLWLQYADAMERRRPDSVLDSYRFESYLLRDDVFMAEEDGSAIIGQLSMVDVFGGEVEIFKVSHFAPKTMRGSARLLRKLARDYGRVVVFTVTDDLTEMLLGCGWSPCGMSFPIFWNGEVETKHIFTQLGNEMDVRALAAEVSEGRLAA